MVTDIGTIVTPVPICEDRVGNSPRDRALIPSSRHWARVSDIANFKMVHWECCKGKMSLLPPSRQRDVRGSRVAWDRPRKYHAINVGTHTFARQYDFRDRPRHQVSSGRLRLLTRLPGGSRGRLGVIATFALSQRRHQVFACQLKTHVL